MSDSLARKKQIDEIVHGQFVKEGTFVAFPTCFPGASAPISWDESRVTSLARAENGTVYGGTSGRKVHLFVAMFQGVTGVVFDLGGVPCARDCASVVVGEEKLAALVCGPEGASVVVTDLQGLPFDLIQEWGFRRPEFQIHGPLDKVQRWRDACMLVGEKAALGLSESQAFLIQLEQGEIQPLGSLASLSGIGRGMSGDLWGVAEKGLWRYSVRSGEWNPDLCGIPTNLKTSPSIRFSKSTPGGPLYLADGEGKLYLMEESTGLMGPVGQLSLCPVGPMAVTLDGRLFGFSGEGMARLFVYEPAGQVRDLGVAVSVLQKRRYGYVFGDAVTGRDGQIIFGENDEGGHLWLYFPRIQA